MVVIRFLMGFLVTLESAISVPVDLIFTGVYLILLGSFATQTTIVRRKEWSKSWFSVYRRIFYVF